MRTISLSRSGTATVQGEYVYNAKGQRVKKVQLERRRYIIMTWQEI